MTLDPRLNPYRSDLAAIHLKGQVTADRFAEGEPRQVVAGATAIRREPRSEARQESEVLFGETFTVYETRGGWAWGQLQTDGYVGYVEEGALGAPGSEATHRTGVVRTFLYPEPDLKTRPVAVLSLGARVSVRETVGDYAALDGGGHVIVRHLVAADHAEPDFVSVAERFLETPYFWGGRTSIGLDCSALLQLSLQAAGVAAPRDSDMQEATLGADLPMDALEGGLERGDLIFWRGHVAIMVDETRMLHTNGHHMSTRIEPVRGAVQRILDEWGPVTSVKRLNGSLSYPGIGR